MTDMPLHLAAQASEPRSRQAAWLQEWPAFRNWLMCWLVLPNLPFLPVTVLGGPPRFPEVLICGIAGLAARRLPYLFRAIVFVALMAWLLATFIARMFNLDVSMIMSVIGLVFDLDVMASGEYVAGGLLFAVSAGGALWLLRRRGTFADGRWALAAVCATGALAAADFAVSRDTMGSYSRVAPVDAPLDSAIARSGLVPLADGRANVLIVLVEAMGEPTDPAVRRRLETLWMRPELADRFAITRGDTAFYGSTTNAEMRELCGRWGNYPEIEGPQPDCLPAVLRAQGYGTAAYHGFLASFFDRQRWYPLIGFERTLFAPELTGSGARVCGSVFSGACDTDIPAIIAKDLQRADSPQLAYWVTLNSHLPVVSSKELGTENCGQLGAELDARYPMVCRLFALWEQTADSLAEAAMSPDFPVTHILIVGDHMPPFTHQGSRLQFDSGKVPWVLLRDKRAQPGSSLPLR